MSARDGIDTLAPETSISVNGEPLPNAAAADVVNVTVLEDVGAASMFSLTLTAWDTVQMKPKWIDDDLFREGNQVEAAFGYGSSMQKVFIGDITSVEADFPRGQPPTLTVRGHDRRHRMMRSRQSQTFTQCKDSDIARQLASNAGLRPDVKDTEVVLPYVLQHNQTDLEFLAYRARRIGYEVWVREDNLVFKPPHTNAQATLTLTREIDLLSFRPRLTTMSQVSELEIRGWNPAQKKEIVGRGRAGDESGAMPGAEAVATGPARTERAFGRVASARVGSPVQSQEEADAMARLGYAHMALRFLKAEGIAIGQPKLRAGIVVALQGMGERFGGNYYVTSAEHEFSRRQGYRTRFSAKRNAR